MYGHQHLSGLNPERCAHSLLYKGKAVGALIDSGVAFMGANSDTPQRAVILGRTMILALGDRTLNALVCFCTHNK